jgi:hypothetical protein
MGHMEEQQNPFENELLRAGLGLTSGLIVAMVALFFFEGTMRLLLLGFAAFDAVFTPYMLKKAAVQQRQANDPTA